MRACSEPDGTETPAGVLEFSYETSVTPNESCAGLSLTLSLRQIDHCAAAVRVSGEGLARNSSGFFSLFLLVVV